MGEDNSQQKQPETAQIQQGDVLLTFNGHALDNNGFSELLGRRLHFAVARDICQVGTAVPVSVWRDRAELHFEHLLRPAQYLVPRGQYDTRPRYFICGGLVFQPLTHEYLQGWSINDRPAHLQDLFQRGHLTPLRNEVVIISTVLADAVNTGYDSGWIGAPVVHKVNGEPVRNLPHLISVVRAARMHEATDPQLETFLNFEVSMSGGPFRFALPAGELQAAERRISAIYGVPAACCS